MTGKVQFLLLAVMLVLSAAPAWAAPDVQEGTWEITTVTEMGGAAMQMPPQKHVQCLKQGDLVPQDPHNPQTCVFKEQSVKGNTVNWTVECSAGGVKSVSTGSITYSGDRFSGRMDIAMDGTDMKLASTMTGRRLGPCK
jgi:hypothetical protein